MRNLTHLQLKYILFLFIICSLLSACKKEEPAPQPTPTPAPPTDPDPVACYTVANGRMIELTDILKFQNCSKDCERYEWDFGDALSSSVQEPSHKWSTKGIYDVSLTGYRGAKTNKITKAIIVGLDAFVNFKADLSGWKIPTGHNNVQIGINVHRSSEINGTPQFGGFSTTYGGSLPPSLDIQLAMWDDQSPYKIKIKLVSSSNTESVADSIVTDEILVFGGPKTATGSHSLSLVNMSYTIGSPGFH